MASVEEKVVEDLKFVVELVDVAQAAEERAAAQAAAAVTSLSESKEGEGRGGEEQDQVGKEEKEKKGVVKTALGRGDGELKEIIERLPPLSKKTDVLEGGLLSAREASKKPLPKGTLAPVSFPIPPSSSKSVPVPEEEEKEKILEITRFSPSGNVDHHVTEITVAFSHPMTELGAASQSIVEEPPIQISPALPKGRWRWLDPLTLVFEAEYRLPQSSTFKLKVDAGLTDVTKTLSLQKDVEWSVNTSQPKLVEAYPNEGQLINPAFNYLFLLFDGEISVQQFRMTGITVQSDRKNMPLKALTRENDWKKVAEKEPVLKPMLESAKPKHFVLFEYTSSLQQKSVKTEQHVRITNIPSAEGKRAFKAPSFKAPSWLARLDWKYFVSESLARTEVTQLDPKRCAARNTPASFDIIFNCALKPDLNTKKILVSVTTIEDEKRELDLEEISCEIRNSYRINVSSKQFKARTKYKFVMDEKEIISDTGMILPSHFASFTQEVGRAPQTSRLLNHVHGGQMIADPDFPTFDLEFCTLNFEEIKVKVFVVKNLSKALDFWDNKFHRLSQESLEPELDSHEAFTLAVDKKVQIEKDDDVEVVTHIPLSKAELFPETDGKGIALITSSCDPVHQDTHRRHFRHNFLCQFTHLSVDAAVFNTHPGKKSGYCRVWATNYLDTKPVEGVTVSFEGSDLAASTDCNGVAHLDLSSSAKPYETGRLIAQFKNDIALLPHVRKGGSELKPRWLEHLFFDRSLYKPKETVRFKCFLRMLVVEGEDLKIERIKKDLKIKCKLIDSRANEVAQLEVPFDVERSSFQGEVVLPDNVNLGFLQTRFEIVEGKKTIHNIYQGVQVDEFRLSGFKSNITLPADRPHFFPSEEGIVKVDSVYYSGEPLNGASVTWTATTFQDMYRPPGHDAYSFGKDHSFPFGRRGRGNFGFPQEQDPFASSATFKGVTDEKGEHSCVVRWKGGDPKKSVPVRIQINAEVQDLDRQVQRSTGSFIVHGSRHYVGVKTKNNFVSVGTNFGIDFVVCDPDGKKVDGVPITVSVVQCGSKVTCCKKEVSESFAFEPTEPGSYELIASVTDEFGCVSTSELKFFVTGQTPEETKIVRRIPFDSLTMVPNKKDQYKPGETAEILINNPYLGANIAQVLFISTKLVHQDVFSFEGATHTISFPILPVYENSVTVTLRVYGRVPRGKSATTRPAFGETSVVLNVSNIARKLDVDVAVVNQDGEQTTTRPGSEVNLRVIVNRPQDLGPAENTDVTLIVVDEALLALSHHEMVDPAQVFVPSSFVLPDFRQSLSLISLSNIPDGEEDVDDVADTDDFFLEEECLSRNTWGGLPQNKGMKKRGKMQKLVAEEEKECEMAPMMAGAPMMALQSCATTGRSFSTGARGRGGRSPRGGGRGGGSPSTTPISLRSNFDALAFYKASVRTDRYGIAKESFKMPDSTSQFRVWAVAEGEASQEFGIGETSLRATLPLSLRPSFPRFLNVGDEVELSVVVASQSSDEQHAVVVVRTDNERVLEISTSANGYKFVLEPYGRVEVRFPVKVTGAPVREEGDKTGPGSALVQVAVTTKEFSDAIEQKIPIYVPATTENVALYGQVDGTATVAQPVALPEKIFSNFGGMDITASSTALQSLSDGFVYVYYYKFDCSEQLASRMLAICALKDVLEAFFKGPQKVTMPTPEKVEKVMKYCISELERRQKESGGWGWWPSSELTSPYCSLHCAHALARAKQKGYQIPSEMVSKAIVYLEKNLQGDISVFASPKTQFSLRALGLHVRYHFGDSKIGKLAAQLLDEFDEIDNVEAIGWLLSPLQQVKGKGDEALSRLMNRVTETPSTASFVCRYGYDGPSVLLYSDIRVNAVITEALIEIDPKNPLIPKLIRGIQERRKVDGAWGSTQENCFVLLAIDRYFQAYEKDEPNYSLDMFVGESWIGDLECRERSFDVRQYHIPMEEMLQLASNQLITFDKKGEGRFYFRLGLEYSSPASVIDALDMGFEVSRKYESSEPDQSSNVKKDGETIEVVAGVEVLVTVTVKTRKTRNHVAIVDQLPAGFEIVKNKSPPPIQVKGRQGKCWYRGHWYSHRNMRDERAEIFVTSLSPGERVFQYYVRATGVGKFVCPPARVEEMYSPEVFGRSSSCFVKVFEEK